MSAQYDQYGPGPAGYAGGGYGPDPGYGAGGGGYGPDPAYGGGPGPAGDYGGYGPGNGYGLPPEQYDYAASDDHGPGPAGQGPPDPNTSYQQYTENQNPSNCIDKENGIAPRRCTDCVCIPIFVLYMLGMIILVSCARSASVRGKPWGDIRRLTHGHDYKGRLCGVDADVVDKPFLYWCREDAVEWSSSPSKLNLVFPSCVQKCPTGGDIGKVACLFEHTAQPMSLKGGPFGTVETYHVTFQQSVALTNPYDAVPFAGRFCVPTNNTMKEQILHNPMRYTRLFYSVGSLQDPWGVLFGASLLAIGLGYAYLFLIKLVPRVFVLGLLYISLILFLASGLFFLYAVADLVVEHLGDATLLTTLGFEKYKGFNPFYAQYTPASATILSVGVAVVLVCIGCGVLGTITHVGGQGFHYIPDLIDASSECWTAMITMLIPPGIEGIMKFFLTWCLAYNFMILMSVGFYEDRRLLINEKLYRDATVVYHFDWRIVPWMVYYIFGWIWIMEIPTACGQFLTSFGVISWYFMKKDGPYKTGVPPLPPVYGALDGVMYHAGSVLLGAAIIPWVRILRVFTWVEDESVPNEDAACCPQDAGALGGALNACCKCIGGLCSKVTAARKACSPACCTNTTEPRSDGLLSTGCMYRYSKNAYNDVIIRSQHFLEASQRAFLLAHKYDSTRMYMLEGKGCQVVTAVGVVSIGLIGMLFTYLQIMGSQALTDPTSPTFIAAPIFVAVLAFFLCAHIAYGFLMLFDHTADTLLYCYAWNKKFERYNGGCAVEEYLPESLRDIVDADLDEEDGYCFYGQARPEMYLSTYLGGSRRTRMQGERVQSKERTGGSAAPSEISQQGGPGYGGYPQATGAGGYFDPARSYGGSPSGPPGYAPVGLGQPYAPVGQP